MKLSVEMRLNLHCHRTCPYNNRTLRGINVFLIKIIFFCEAVRLLQCRRGGQINIRKWKEQVTFNCLGFFFLLGEGGGGWWWWGKKRQPPASCFFTV